MTHNYEISQLSIKFQSNIFADTTVIKELKSSMLRYTDEPGYDTAKTFSGLNEYPFFCYYIPYSDEILNKMSSYKEIVETFFILSKFKNYLTLCFHKEGITESLDTYKNYNHFAEKNDKNNPNDKNTVHHNIEVLLKWLFPVSFPVKRPFRERKDAINYTLIDDRSIIRRFNNGVMEIGATLSSSPDFLRLLSRNYCYMDVHGIPSTLIGGEWNTHLKSHPLYNVELKMKCELYKKSLVEIIKEIVHPKIKEIIDEIEPVSTQNTIPHGTDSFRAFSVIKQLDELNIEKINETPINGLTSFQDYKKFLKFVEPYIKSFPRTGQNRNNSQKENWERLRKYVGLYFYLYHPVFNLQNALYSHTNETGIENRMFSGTKLTKYIDFCKYLSENFATRDIHLPSKDKNIFKTDAGNQIFDQGFFDFKRYLELFDTTTENPYIGVDKININLGQSDLKSKPSYEIYVRLDYVGGIIAKTNEDLATCMYNSNRLGSMYDSIFYLKNNPYLTTKINSQYVDITEELKLAVQKRKEREQAKAKANTSMKVSNSSSSEPKKIEKEVREVKGDRNLSVEDTSPNNLKPVADNLDRNVSSSIDDIIVYNSEGVNPINPDEFKKIVARDFGDVFREIKPDYTTQSTKEKIIDAIGRANTEKQKLVGRQNSAEYTGDRSQLDNSIDIYTNIIKLLENLKKNEDSKAPRGGGKRRKRQITQRRVIKRLSKKINNKTISHKSNY